MRVGLLGGSFNPPHAGHLQFSLAALKDLQLDQVWWLVSPQNPLKSGEGMLPLAERVALSQKLTQHPRIKVVDIEKHLPDTYTITTIRYLQHAMPRTAFFWIMGADNLLQFHQWKNWKELFHLLPIIVYDRGNYRYKALAGKAASVFRKARYCHKKLKNHKLPAWSLVITRKNPLSSTSLREKKLH
jgi:nicotinate-nucleotide adenylyltransferase